MSQNMEPLYDKDFICTCCETRFTSKKVRISFAKPNKLDSDFCPHYSKDGYNPLYYYVHVCPQCGFSFTEQFSDRFPPRAKELIWENISKQWDNRNLARERTREEAISTYKLALFSGKLKDEQHAVMAGICMRLAWMYRYEENQEQEERFMRLALKEYQSAYANDDLSELSMTEVKVLYVIGELNRRLGYFEKAVQYFSRVIEHKNRSTELRMVKMARDQWQLAGEQYRAQQEEEKELG